MLYGTVLCGDCAVTHEVVLGCKPRRCPMCRDVHRTQVRGDLLYLGWQGLKGALSGGALLGLICVTVGAITALAGCV